MHYSLRVFMAIAEEIEVAEDVVMEITHPAKKRTQLLKKYLETPCKNMLLLCYWQSTLDLRRQCHSSL